MTIVHIILICICVIRDTFKYKVLFKTSTNSLNKFNIYFMTLYNIFIKNFVYGEAISDYLP